MLLRHSFSRLPSPPSWISRVSSPAMPLRAKVTNPAFRATASVSRRRSACSDTARDANCCKLSTSPEIPKELPGDEPDDVLFNSIYGLRSVELNRPKKLNSLNGSMARKIFPRLKVSGTLIRRLAGMLMVGDTGMGKVSNRKHHPHLGSRIEGALCWRRCCCSGTAK